MTAWWPVSIGRSDDDSVTSGVPRSGYRLPVRIDAQQVRSRDGLREQHPQPAQRALPQRAE